MILYLKVKLFIYLKIQIYHVEVLPPLNPKSMDLPHLHPYHVSSLYL